MQFVLTYAGPLKATQQDPTPGQPNRLAEHKHEIRREFHKQLKLLWSTNKFLRDHKVNPNSVSLPPAEQARQPGFWGGGPDTRIPMVEDIASQYQESGFRFVPLVRESLSLLCSLDVLFLRRDFPGSVISSGDIDNRIKTLIDALRRPRSGNELQIKQPSGNNAKILPLAEEKPIFLLA